MTYHDNVAIQILADINIALHDGVEGRLVNTIRLKTKNGWPEEGLGSSESLIADGDDLTVRKFVGLLQARALRSSLELLLEVEGNVAELLLDVSNNFSLGSGGECVTSLRQDLHEVVGQITASHVETRNSVGKSETLVDGDDMSDAIARVQHNTSRATGGVKREDGLDRDIEGRGIEGLEDNLGHLLSVRLGVDGGFGQEDRVLLGSDTKFVVECVMPDLLHVVPVRHHTVFNRISQGQDTTLGLSLITDIRVFLTHTDHDTVVTGSTNNGRYHHPSELCLTCDAGQGELTEDCSRGVVAGKPSFAHAGPAGTIISIVFTMFVLSCSSDYLAIGARVSRARASIGAGINFVSRVRALTHCQ